LLTLDIFFPLAREEKGNTETVKISQNETADEEGCGNEALAKLLLGILRLAHLFSAL
jgi:hypothetical protein